MKVQLVLAVLCYHQALASISHPAAPLARAYPQLSGYPLSPIVRQVVPDQTLYRQSTFTPVARLTENSVLVHHGIQPTSYAPQAFRQFPVYPHQVAYQHQPLVFYQVPNFAGQLGYLPPPAVAPQQTFIQPFPGAFSTPVAPSIPSYGPGPGIVPGIGSGSNESIQSVPEYTPPAVADNGGQESFAQQPSNENFDDTVSIESA